MSDVSFGTGTFRVDMDASHMGQATGQALGYMASLEQAVATNWWGIKNLGVAFAALPAAVAAGIGASVRAAMQWEDAMAGVEKTTYDASKSTEENSKNLAVLEDQLLALSRTKPVATVEIAGIAEAAGALGVAQENVAQFTSVVADLSATTDLTADNAATSLARIAGLTNIPAAGYDNLASSILETGRATAATEQQITGIANRINGVGATFRVSGADIIGWSAAMASAGLQAEAAGTQFQKTFYDMQKAISDNGEQLQTWADLTGQSTEEFAASFKQDASGTFVDVIEGLARVQKSGGDVNAILASLGITEARQIRLLTTMAAAQNSTTNESLKLTNIIGLSNDAFREGTALSDIAGRRYDTLSAQVQILWNNFFELANSIGTVFLPVLKLLVGGLQNMAAGFRVLPGPIKLVLAVFVGLLTGILGLLAAVLLIGPRFILAISAIRQFTGSMVEARNAENARVATIERLNAAIERQAQATAVATVAASQSIAAQNAAAEAEARRAAVVTAVTAAQARQSAAEAAYTTTEISLAEARIGMAHAEGEAKLLSMLGTAGGADLLLAAEVRLTTAEEAHRIAAANLTAANQNLLLTDEELIVANQALAAAEAEVALAARAHTIAVTEAAAANGAAAGSATATTAANAGGALSFLRFGGAAGGAAEEVGLLSRVTTGLGKAFTYVAIAGAALSIGTSILGNRQRKAEEDAAKLEEANRKLTDALVEGGDSGKKAAEGWIKQQVEQRNLMGVADDLGITYEKLFRIIAGSADPKEYRAFIDTLKKGNAEGVAGTQQFGNEVRILNRIVANSKDEALAQGASFDVLSDALAGASDSADDLANSLDGVAEAKQKAGASTGYIESLFAEFDASADVVDAQQKLDAARNNTGRQALNIQKAEIALSRARQTAAGSGDEIARAERNLATARVRQAEAVQRAEIELANSQDAYYESLDRVSEAEDKLNDLRDPRGPEALRKAVLDLAEAEKSVRDAQQHAADAQWYLNYLREEGAGARDIKIAENEIADAALETAQATEQKTDAQKELDRLNDPAEQAKAQAAAERELAAARRGVTTASLDIAQNERDLQDARDDQSNNRLVRDAENEIADARAGQVENTIAVKDAENELAKARADAKVDEAAKAAEEYERALFRQAQAIAENRKQVLLLAGEEVDAADESHILGDALQEIVDKMPDGASKKRLQDFVDVLKDVPEIPKGSIDAGLGLDGGTGTVPQIAGFGAKNPLEDLKTGVEDPGLWDSIKQAISDNFVGIFALAGSLIVPALAGAFQGAAIGTAFAGPLGTIVGGIVGLLIGLLVKGIVQNWSKIVNAVVGFVKDIPSKLQSLVNVLGDFFSKLPGRLAYAAGWLLGFVLKAVVFAVKNIGKTFIEFGKDLWEAMKAGIAAIRYLLSDEFRKNVTEGLSNAWDTVSDPAWWGALWDRVYAAVTGALGDAGQFLLGIGADIVKGFWKGFSDAFPEGAKFLEDAWDSIIRNVREFFGIASPSKLMAEIGGYVIDGFWQGIRNAWNTGFEFFTGLPDEIRKKLEGAAGWLLETGTSVIEGLWAGMKYLWNLVSDWVGGLGGKIADKVTGTIDGLAKEGGKLFDAGKDIMQGLWDGLKSLWQKVIDWIEDKIDLIPKRIRELMGIASPSKVMREIGQHIGDGLGIGLRAGMERAVNDFEKISKELDPSVISENFKNFGIDTLDVAAFTGQIPTVPASLGVTATAPAANAAVTPAAIDRQVTYQLTAITAASPGEIVDEFAWAESIHSTRGNQP